MLAFKTINFSKLQLINIFTLKIDGNLVRLKKYFSKHTDVLINFDACYNILEPKACNY